MEGGNAAKAARHIAGGGEETVGVTEVGGWYRQAPWQHMDGLGRKFGDAVEGDE